MNFSNVLFISLFDTTRTIVLSPHDVLNNLNFVDIADHRKACN